MADRKYSGKSGSDSKDDHRKSKRTFDKSKSSTSRNEERPSYKKDDAKPRRSFADKDKKSSSGVDKSFSKYRNDKGSSSDKKDKFKKSDKPFRERKSFDPGFKKDEGDKPKRSYSSSDSRERKPYDRDAKFEKKPYSRDDKYKKEDGDKPKRSYDKSYFDRDARDKKKHESDSKRDVGSYSRNDKYKRDEDSKPRRTSSEDRPRINKDSDDRKPYFKKEDGGKRERTNAYDKPERKKYSDDGSESKRFKKDDFSEGKGFKGHDRDKKDFKERSFKKRDGDSKPKKHNDDGLIRLNKYLANAGISSRRDADTLILSGTVKVNGKVVDTLGYKVKADDVVTYADSAIKNERKVYLLLNKPKDFITTTDDPQERRTVMELVRTACKERIYPVGRLDRNTTGLLLFTNDGDIATKLMHPKHEIRKVYHVSLNKPLRGEDYKAISEGIELEDGPVKVDDIAFVGEGKKEIGLEIHSGRNRIVRRIFEHLGYEVIKLDRVTYAGLTKKDLPRGKYRFLTEKEISFLKMLG